MHMSSCSNYYSVNFILFLSFDITSNISVYEFWTEKDSLFRLNKLFQIKFIETCIERALSVILKHDRLVKPSCCRKIKRNIFNKKYHRYVNCLSSRTWPNYRVFETKNVNNNYLKKVHHSLRCGSGDSFALVEEMHFISCYQWASLKFRWNKNGVSVVKTASNKHIQYL